MNSYGSPPTKAIDDLPGKRCTNALAMLQFMRRQPIKWFTAGSPSAQVAQDLADCGYFRLREETDGVFDFLVVEEVR